MKKILSSVLIAVLVQGAVATAAVRGDKAVYRGGTVESLKQKTEGRLDLQNEKLLVFTTEKGVKWELPYNQVTIIEYGQKVGRRVGASIATALLVSPVGLFMLFSKKKKHFLSIGWKDEAEKEQGAVLELGKNTVRTTLKTLEARTGKKVEYESEEAKKGIGN